MTCWDESSPDSASASEASCAPRARAAPSGRASRNRYAFAQLTGGPVTIPSYTGVATGAVAAACLAAGCAAPPSKPATLICPYAPWYQHPYRHGAVATRETQQGMQAWYASHAAGPVSNVLSFGGAVDGIGVASGPPRVHLVFYGDDWTGCGQPQTPAAHPQSL